MAATPDLDLAFTSNADLPPELLLDAGAWVDPFEGADPWHHLLASWLEQLATELPSHLRARSYSLGLSLVGDAAIAELNADWREQEGPTDVLAFAAQDEDLEPVPPMPHPVDADHDAAGGEPLELGDIVISVETAARQATEHDHSLEQELLFLASHGLLHLLGWDHPDEPSLAAMLARQDRLVNVRAEP